MKAFTGEPRFYSGQELRTHLSYLIQDSSKIDIATAWVSNSSAVELLLSDSTKAAVRMVVGIGGYNTDPVALKALGGSEPKITLKIHGAAGPPLFHPKLYVFQHAHFRRLLVGSMNLTNAGATANIESMFSAEDRQQQATKEFDRFWNSPDAVAFERFDLVDYEAKRREKLAAVKAAGAADVLEADVMESAESRIEVDALREDWRTYFGELKSRSDGLNDHLRVLRVRQQFVDRDWSTSLNENELDIMYGKAPYYAFGRLNAIRQAQFQGSVNRPRRQQIGAILRSAAKLQGFQRPIVERIVRQLLDVEFLGPAIVTRLLILARPDFFVVVNKKSFEGLRERFGLFVSNQNFDAANYVKLLEKIHATGWCRSPEPTDPFE